MESETPTVAVVGAGASGTLAAIHLLADATNAAVRVVLLSDSGTLGRGVAYGTPDPSHLLNVPAGSMSAFPDDPDDFVHWLEGWGYRETQDQLVERRLYGAYLEDRLHSVAARATTSHALQVIYDQVVDIETGRGAPVLVTKGGRHIAADAVVLATGPRPARAPRCCREVEGNDRFIVDPWRPDALAAIGPTDEVTLIGTGLTCVDVLLSLDQRGHAGPIYAFSRHGLLPHEHRADLGAAPSTAEDPMPEGGATARELLHHIRELVHREADRNVDWRIPIDRMRPHVSDLWERLSDTERRRFRRHAERYWDIHRHRMGPAAAGRIRQLRQDGRLHVSSGRLIGASVDGDLLSLTFSLRRGDRTCKAVHTTRWLINCTGSTYAVEDEGETLVSRLVAWGAVRPGSLGLGVDATCSGRVLDGQGNRVDWLWGLGPLLRGRLYETTAVPEIRVQARNLATEIREMVLADPDRAAHLERGDQSPAAPTWAMPKARDLLEVVTFESPDVGDRSYLVHSGPHGVVIDPQCDIARVESEAERRGVHITHVFETHIHNDYVSGGLVLARRLGATYALSADEPVAFGDERLGVRGGDTIHVGSLEVDVVHTPGHTPHHLSYVVRLGADDAALFSGGSMLHDATGRTDLFDLEAAEMLARAQWRSVRRLADSLGPETVLCPTHGFGSFCAASGPSSAGNSTVGEQFLRNPALLHDEQTFVSNLLRNRRPYPRYYGHMAPFNRQDTAATFPATLRRGDARAAAGSDGAVVVDLRPRRDFASSHLAGSLNVEWGDSFAAYLGWTVPWGAPVTLVAQTWAQAERAAEALARIGIGEVSGVLHDPTHAQVSYRVADFADLAAAAQRGEPLHVIDARDRAEWDADHLSAAELMPFYCVEAGVSLLPHDVDQWVHCARGYRAAIAASLLERGGRRPVLIDDTFDHAVALGLTGQLQKIGA
jgi:uncharacterized NAD(P)/FAD-binding protein YdhS/glyoxylase-like metal-dependent hydrolase (beta-lactamase superfamily II)/rhodanese-related sulfurtransferase